MVILYITTKKTKKIQENFDETSKIEQLIDTSKIKRSSIENLMLITNLDVIKENEHDRFPDKHLLILGKNLNKVEDVYFGDLKGIILESQELDNMTEIRVLPPNFSKFTKMKDQKEFEDIEIKLKIDDPVDDEPRNVIFSNQETINFNEDIEYAMVDQVSTPNAGTLVIENPKELDTTTSKKVKLTFKINYKKTLDGNINTNPLKMKLNDKEYKLNLDFIKDDTENEEGKKEFSIIVNARDLSKIKYNIDTNKNFEENFIIRTGVKKLSDLSISNMTLEYLHDDINILLPTGLFYRFDYTTSGENLLELDPNSWNIFLSDRLERSDVLITEDVRKFYQDIKNLTSPPPAEKIIIVLKVGDLKVDKVNGDDTILRMSWKTPPAINNFRFAFLINVVANASNDKFSIKDEQISFEKESFDFPTNKLTPGNEYTVQVSTYRTDKREVVDNSEPVVFRYVPPNFDDYHSHLFDPVTKRFKTELTQEKPELIKSYYQLLAANKIKALNEMNQAESHIKNEAQCMEGNLNQLMNNTSNDAFDDNLRDQLNSNAEAERAVYEGKQNEQNDTIERVRQKVAELEKLQGKIKKVQNTNIKRVTSQKDGTDLSVKKLSNGKFLVGMNKGCLAVNKSGDYNYIPCNIFDKRQYFDIESIENNDEYNNLLLMNLNSKLAAEQRVEYPFQILKPEKSTKCVHMNDKKIQIKPCDDDESIRFTSHFYQNDKCEAE